MTGQRLQKTPEQMTDIQKRFVIEYMIDLNATQAWIRAGGSPNFAERVGHRMLKANTMTGQAVARAMAERSVRVGISGDRVLRELGRLAFGDTRVLFRADGSLKPPSEYDENDSAMIEGIKTRRIVEVGIKEDGSQGLVPVEIQEVKLASKTTALSMLMRHLGMNNDKLDVNITPLAQALEAAYKRTGTERVKHDDDTDEDDDLAIEGEYEEVADRPLITDELADLLK